MLEAGKKVCGGRGSGAKRRAGKKAKGREEWREEVRIGLRGKKREVKLRA